MSDKAKWKEFIVRGNDNRLGRINRRLFVDHEETIGYLTALKELAVDNLGPGHSCAPRLKFRIGDLFRQARQTLSTIGHEDATQFLERLWVVWDKFEVAYFLLGAAEGESSSPAIFDLLLYMLFLDAGDASRTHRGIGMFLLGAVIGQCHKHFLWENVLASMRSTGDVSHLQALMEVLGIFGVEINIILSRQWSGHEFAISTANEVLRVNLPIPERLYSWFVESFEVVREHHLRNERVISGLLDAFRGRYADYQVAYENMWLDMMVRPRHLLRPDGLDCVRVEIPELRGVGYWELHLYPASEFPEFRARYTYDRFGRSRYLHMVFEPSGLSLVNPGNLPDSDPRVWMDRVLGFIALRSVWRIVMNQLPKTGTADGQGGSSSAVVRAHIRRLPEGQQISPEARARALACFRTVPLPGFTFVTGYTRGDNPTSGDPLFDITAEELQS